MMTARKPQIAIGDSYIRDTISAFINASPVKQIWICSQLLTEPRCQHCGAHHACTHDHIIRARFAAPLVHLTCLYGNARALLVHALQPHVSHYAYTHRACTHLACILRLVHVLHKHASQVHIARPKYFRHLSTFKESRFTVFRI
eukprot:6173398-Pleurochrysis_carterae.AAC.3